MPALTPIKFDLIGANDRTRNALAMVFNRHARGDCELALNGQADAVIVDLDGVGARSEWGRYTQQYPHRPSVLLTITACAAPETAIVLSKPICIEFLLGAIAEVRGRIDSSELPAPSITLRATPSRIQDMLPSAAWPEVAAAISPTTALPSRAGHSQAKRAVAAPAPPPAEADAGNGRLSKETAPEPVKDYRDVCGTAEDINCDDPEQVRRCCFDADSTLLDWMRRAVAHSESALEPVSLTIQGREIAVLSAGERMARVSVSDDTLKQLCSEKYPLDVVEMRPATTKRFQSTRTVSTASVSLEELLWKTALWTYQGRLPVDTPIKERVYLRRWPNLTRLVDLLDAMRIAALMVEQPLTLPRVAEALAIPQRQVFAFYGAAQAAGLAGQAKREADHLFAPTALRPHVARGFVQRIVSSLKRLVG